MSFAGIFRWLTRPVRISSQEGSSPEDERKEVLAYIETSRAEFDEMVGRVYGTDASGAGKAAVVPPREPAEPDAKASSEARPPMATFVKMIQDDFAALTQKVEKATTKDEFDQLKDEADSLARHRAYLCPVDELTAEAKSYVAALKDWGVPSGTLDSISARAAPAMQDKIEEPAKARGALFQLYADYDSWFSYVDEYNDGTDEWANRLKRWIVYCVVTSLLLIIVVPNWLPERSTSWVLPLRVFVIVLAAVAGASASVIARLPGLTSYGEWKVNERAFLARISTGIVGSLVAVGLLGSGVISVTLPDPWKNSGELLQACVGWEAQQKSNQQPAPSQPGAPATSGGTSSLHSPCTPGGALFLLAVTMLFGFSERLLTSLESRVVPAGSGAQASGRS